MTFAPEESYLSTVLVNLTKGREIIPYNYRFILWKWENGNRPANLGMQHFKYLVESDCFFARKMERPYCESLQQVIDRYFLHDEEQTVSLQPSGGWIYDGYLRYRYNSTFTQAIVQLCDMCSIDYVLDMGCGAGIYVAALRDKGISIAGYDANPFVESLSRRLFPQNDEYCGQADLTQLEPTEDTFDLVICKNVLEYIPKNMWNYALRNLVALSSKYILIGWSSVVTDVSPLPYFMNEVKVLALFQSIGCTYESMLTNMIRKTIHDVHSNYFVFRTCNTPIRHEE